MGCVNIPENTRLVFHTVPEVTSVCTILHLRSQLD